MFKVADNRMFAAMSEADGAVRLTVKLTAEEREIAMLLPYVEKAKYVGRYGWVTAVVRTTSRSTPRSNGCARATGSARPNTSATPSKPTTSSVRTRPGVWPWAMARTAAAVVSTL